ncbi:MAG: hypothetical protein K2N73_10435 [Lachnospiraceae bacterium]|nr:hypothetical protein [Lachnospiraceae bacterium]
MTILKPVNVTRINRDIEYGKGVHLTQGNGENGENLQYKRDDKTLPFQ